MKFSYSVSFEEIRLAIPEFAVEYLGDLEMGMRIYTVTKGGKALAVVRAADPADAMDTALALTGEWSLAGSFDIRDPTDAEMVGWLERRADYSVAELASAN